MKTNGLLSLMLFCLLLGAGCSKDPEVQPEPETDVHEERIAFLDQVLHPLTDADAATDFAPLSELAAARIIGLGEASHGAREFFEFKNRLIPYLVTEHGLQSVAFEGFEFGQAQDIDRYVTTGEGDPETLLSSSVMYRVETVRDLLLWLRDYNRDKPAGEQVRFFGIDLTRYAGQPDALVAGLQAFLPELADSVATTLAGYEAALDQYYELDQATLIENRSAIRGAVQEVRDKVAAAFDELSVLASPAQARIILHQAEVIVQTESVIYSMQYNPQSAELLRDKYMAENVAWVSDHLGDAKIAVWAHNGHVANDNFFREMGPSMGALLREQYGDDYQIIGFSMGAGVINATMTADGESPNAMELFSLSAPAPNSVNDLFSRAAAPQYFVFLEELMTDAGWAEWLRTDQLFLSVGSVYLPEWGSEVFYPIDLETHFDVIVHFDETTPSVLLD